MNVSTITGARVSADVAPGLGATIRSEWVKLYSARSSRIIIALAIILSIATSAIVALIIGITYDGTDANSLIPHDPVTSSLTGLLFRMILLTALSVTVVSSEYSSGMIRTTFINTPRRGQVLAAKSAVIAGVAVVVGLLTVPVMFLVCQPIFSAYGLETASLADGDIARHVFVFAVGQALVYTLIGFSMAWLLRNTAGAITAAMGFLLLPYFVAPVMPEWVQENILKFSPDLAVDSLAGMSQPGDLTYLDPLPALVVILAWLAAGIAASAIVLNRRDV